MMVQGRKKRHHMNVRILSTMRDGITGVDKFTSLIYIFKFF